MHHTKKKNIKKFIIKKTYLFQLLPFNLSKRENLDSVYDVVPKKNPQ